MKIKIKTVIFDFDGTIADTLPQIISLFNRFAKDYGFERLTKKEVEKLRNSNPLDIIKEFGISTIKLPFIAAKIRKELEKVVDKFRLIPGMKEVILDLKKRKVPLGILTSNSQNNVKKFLRLHNMLVFDFIHNENNLFGKGQALKHLLQKYSLSPNELIYIGDEVRDIDACKENKVAVMAVTWGFNKKEILKKSEPDFLIDKPREILSLMSTEAVDTWLVQQAKNK